MAPGDRQLLLDVAASTGLRWLSTPGTREAELALEQAADVCLCFYGPEGCGKSTLMRLALLRDPLLALADDLDRMDKVAQEALFHTFNSRGGRGLIVASRVPVAQLDILPDLKSRLLTGLQVEMRLPEDADLRRLLALWAEARQIVLPEAVTDYVLLRADRNPHALADLLARLDRLSLEQKRAVTVPLARAVLGG